MKIKFPVRNYFLRISPAGVYWGHDYEEELFIINTLCENGIRVVSPVRCKDGSLIWEIDAPDIMAGNTGYLRAIGHSIRFNNLLPVCGVLK